MKGRLLRGFCSAMRLKMDSGILISVLICSIVLVTVSGAPAFESSDVSDADGGSKSDNTPSSGMRAEPRQWEVFARTTALGSSGMSGYGGNLTMQEVDTGFRKRFIINSQLELSTGLHYSLRNIDAPGEALLPTSLHRIAMDMRGSYRWSDKLTLNLMVSPGLSSDLEVITSSDIRVPVGLSANYHVSPRVTLMGGFMYVAGNSELPLLPVIGAMYRPSDQWSFALAFPRTGVAYKPSKETEYYLGAEFSAGEYQLHDSALKADIISYRDFRAVVGTEWALLPSVELGVAAGYAFSRKFVFRDSSRDDIGVNGAPFGRVELKFLW